ncbi:MAG TPA: hypothetical protein VK119_03480 [Bacillota bacterium]|nr:hypothetical protein [Bacillota bacterium]
MRNVLIFVSLALVAALTIQFVKGDFTLTFYSFWGMVIMFFGIKTLTTYVKYRKMEATLQKEKTY